MASSTQSHHGMLAFLYHTTKPEYVEHLEKAIWTSKIGKYRDALEIFNNHLSHVIDVPIVLIELSYLHYHNFRYRDVCNLLEPRLEQLKQDDPTKLDEPEWRLLALIYSVGANRCRGWMEPGITELRRTQQWLASLPVSEYTELHVHIAWRYIIAYLMTRLQTELEGNLNDYHRIPLPNDPTSTVEWQGLGDLRRELVKQCRWKEAQAIFKPELNRTPLKQRRIVAEGFLQDLDECSDPNRNFMISSVRLQMAKAMVEVHELDSAKDDIGISIKTLDQWCVDVGLNKGASVPLRFEIEQVQLGFISDHEERLRTAVNLADRMSEFGHCNESSCLDVAAETANKAADLTGNLDYRKQCLALRERLERYNEEVTGDICDLSTHAYETHSIAQHTHVDARKAIEWVDGFMAKYPDFKAPRVMVSLWTRKAILLHTVRDLEAAEVAAAEALKWKALTGNWRGVNVLNSSNVMAPGDGAIGEAPYDSEEDNDDEDGILSGWTNAYGEERPSVIVSKMIGFALQDLAAGRLSVPDVCLVFDIRDHIEEGALEDALNSLKDGDQTRLFKRLWLPAKKTEEKEKTEGKEKEGEGKDEDQTHEVRYEFVRKWLQQFVRGSRDRRLMSLLRFLDIRKDMASDAGLRDMAIRDCENLLTLWESLPRMLKEFTSSWSYAWHAAMAWNYWSKFISGGQWTLFDNYRYLLKIDDLCDTAIEGYRKTNQVTGLANIQRLQAQVALLVLRRLCIYKKLFYQKERTAFEERVIEISREQFGEIENAENAIPVVRELGLKLLIDIDDVYTSTEREACWEDGLEGIQKRTELSRMQMSHTTTRYAIRHWIDGVDELSEEARIAVWHLTQKYKARLLSLAIGMYRTNPPSLIQRIQVSDEALMYQEMVDLQTKIDEADPKDRFYLRLRLDEHRKKSKEYPLLRQLIELREGTPLSLDSLENLTSELDDDVVLVDWFYLDPFFDRGKLLMLTVRKGGIPTVDEISVDVSAVEKWKKDYLNASDWPKGMDPPLAGTRVRLEFNQVCGAVVQPLAMRTKPSDILVLCPTEFLNGLPLHALNIEDEALIWRNPCVYIHSHSLLRPCTSAAQYALDSATPVNPKFISGIAAEAGEAVATFTQGRDSIGDLAEQLQGTAMIDESATKANFLKHAKESRLIHIQTHCSWDSSSPLDHHIEFAAQEEDSATEGKLTAREVFGLRLQQGAHLNVIACSGAMTDIKAGDEVMGLVPAMLYSGASSVVSTLWPTHDGVGALFSRVFFDNFVEQRDEKGTKWVNMARAVQEGVMELDPDQNAGLLTWASIVLNGYWMFAI